MPPPTASELLTRKHAVPSDMLSRDWARVDLAIRERSFFMASVNNHEILDVFKTASIGLEAGQYNTARASEIVREKLKAKGYAPKPGTEGSIKDLSSWHRIRVTLETNRGLVQGMAGYSRQLAAVRVFPAKRMVRLTPKKEPRNWPQRWLQVAASVAAIGINVGDMSAHIMHPVWVKLSRFGAPYPIYDFGSGMGDKALRLDEARKLGVDQMPPPAEPTATPSTVGRTEAQRRSPKANDVEPSNPSSGEVIEPSLNESLEATPDIENAEVRQALAEQLNGTAKWEPGPTPEDPPRFVYLDPNGTRPDTAEAIASTITRRTLPDSPRYQLDAAAAYAAEGRAAFTPGSDALYDMARLVHRIEPMAAPPPLWHGRDFQSAFERDLWIESLRDALLPDAGFPWLATATEPAAALGQIGTLENSVLLNLRGATAARDLRPVMQQVGRDSVESSNAQSLPAIFIEAGKQYRILKSEEGKHGVTHLTIEEIPNPQQP
jgi:hypothetical protein